MATELAENKSMICNSFANQIFVRIACIVFQLQSINVLEQIVVPDDITPDHLPPEVGQFSVAITLRRDVGPTMCCVSEKFRSNESHSIESASFDQRPGHWKIARSGYITTERDGYFEEFAARKLHDLSGRVGLSGPERTGTVGS